MDAYFRAMMRDARNVDRLVSDDPFSALEWKKQPKEEPDPFNGEERDKILEFIEPSDLISHMSSFTISFEQA